MSFRDCLISAVQQGAITKAEAEDLARRFDEDHAQLKLSLGDDAAAAAAKTKLEKDLRAEAIEKRRTVLLQEAAQDRVAEYLQGHRNLKGNADVFGAALNLIEHYGFSGTSSMAGRAKAMLALAHGELADVLFAFRRSKLTGARFNKPLLDDVVRAVIDDVKEHPEATAMGESIAHVNEALRQRFNAAGGAVGKIEGGYLPQFHDARALLKAGRDEWKNFIRPRLDVDRMKDPLTADKLTPARLEQSLDAAFDAVTTDGWIKRQPQTQPFGRGSLANQRAEQRFLMFKDANGWLEYNREFGKGDPLKAIFEHINGMTRDIAAMEALGPNPNATIEWVKQIVQNEAAKSIAGRPSLYDAGSRGAEGVLDQLRYLPWRIDSAYQYVRGRQVVSNQLAAGVSNVRNVLTSAILGSASVLAATTDPFIDMSARYLSGLPMTKALWGIASVFSKGTREQAVRSGIILDDFLHILGDEARYVGMLGGSEWSKWLADRTVQLSGLEPITQARRHVFALDWQAHLADHADKGMADLPAYTQRAMQGYGIDQTAWDAMRAVPAHAPDGGAGFMRPIDIANAAEGPALPKLQKLLGIDTADEALAAEQTRAGMRRVAEQYLEMINGETERAVPTGSGRARSLVTGFAPRGTVFGELMESGLQFKSFTLSFTTLQLQALQQELHQGLAKGAAYAGAVGLAMTFGGALAIQIKHVINGKDVQPMDDVRFWMHAFQTGGGAGTIGDLLFSDVTRQDQGLASTLMGPTVGLINDTAFQFVVKNAQKLSQGKPTHIGREAVNLAGRYTPVLSSLLVTREAYRRMFLDQLQYLADPEAHKNFREQEQRLRRDTRQEFFWPPGQMAPERAPALPH